MKKAYRKPEIKNMQIRLNSAIADTCWGLTEQHTHQEVRYYDIKNTGIVSFNVKQADNNCGAPDAYNIYYIQYEGSDPISLVAAESAGLIKSAANVEKELEAALSSKGGNNGQPYKGIDVDFPTLPIPDSI